MVHCVHRMQYTVMSSSDKLQPFITETRQTSVHHRKHRIFCTTLYTLVQAFISSRLDYCNALLYGVSDGLMRRLQSVQNAAARLVTGARRRDQITPILRQLHCVNE